MATHAAELSRALADGGNAVTVLSASDLIMSGVRHRVWNNIRVSGNLKEVQLGAFGFWRGAQINFRIRRYLRQVKSSKIQSSLIHLHEFEGPLNYVLPPTVPVVWTNHSSMFLKAWKRGEHERLSSIVNKCDWITAPSKELTERVGELGFPSERISYIPNGVDTDIFRPAEKRPETLTNKNQCVFVAARRFVWKNGLHELLRAISMLPHSLQDNISFWLVGDAGANNEYAVALRTKMDKLRREGWRVRNHGTVPNSEMPRLYAKADVALLPSFMEATSIAGLEAMACGLPIIGSKVGGIPEIVDHMRTGLLSDPADAESLADNIAIIARDAKLRSRLGFAGREKAVREFSWSRIAKRYEAVYEECISSS